MAVVCINYASKSMVAGDSVSASQFLSKGKDFAEQAKNATLNPPDKWNNNNVGSDLFEAANKLSDAISHESDYVDSGKASDGAAALDDASAARDSVEDATSTARSDYVAMGGHSSDLEAMQDQVQSLQKTFDALTGAASGGNDDSN